MVTSLLKKKKPNNYAFKKNLRILLPISKCVIKLKYIPGFAVGQNTNGTFYKCGVSLIQGIMSFGGTVRPLHVSCMLMPTPCPMKSCRR